MRECGPKVQRGGLDPLDLLISSTHCALCGGVSGRLCLRKVAEKKEEGKGKVVVGGQNKSFCMQVSTHRHHPFSQCQALLLLFILLFSHEISITGNRIGAHICIK